LHKDPLSQAIPIQSTPPIVSNLRAAPYSSTTLPKSVDFDTVPE